MAKKMEHDMESGFMLGFMGIWVLPGPFCWGLNNGVI